MLVFSFRLYSHIFYSPPLRPKNRKFTLSKEAIGQIIQREQATREALERRRLQAVRLYGSGEDMGVIERISRASQRTIRRWVEQYRAHGLAGLKPGWQGGNHRGLSTAQRVAVGVQLREFSPVQVLGAGNGEFWTVESVQRLVQQQYGVTYRSVRSYHSLLEESGLSYQRPEGIYRSRPREAVIAQWEAEAEKK
jgi:transposase